MRRKVFNLIKILVLVLPVLLLPLLSACDDSQSSFDEILPSLSQSGTPLVLDEITMVAENGLYELWVDPEICSFEIRSKTGTIWRSLPEYYDDGTRVHDMLIPNLASLLTVTALDASFARQELHSYEHCLQTGGISYESIPDGVRITFRYARQGLTIALNIILTQDGFIINVAPGDIAETGDFIVNQITLMPYFNSGSSDDDGFLFYPDGSGAISDYKRDYNNPADIINPVYGFDNAIGTIEAISNTQGYRMPVFGAKTNDAAYLAVIEGDASFISSIVTGVKRGNNCYFKNGAIFTYRDVGRVALRDNQTTVSTNYTVPAPVTATAPLLVRYLLLEGDDISYTDMAFAYRDYLERWGVLSKRSGRLTDMHLTLAGAVKRPSSFIGIPMEREITLTTFKQANEILGYLQNNGVRNINVVYKGVGVGGYNSQWTNNFKFNSSIGGERGWEEFLQSLENTGHTASLSGELLQVYKTGRGFSTSGDAVRTTGGGISFQYDYFVQDGSRNAFARRWYLLAPRLWQDAFSQVREVSYMTVEDAGRLVYSDYNSTQPLYRDRTGPALVRAMRKEEGQLVLSYGNAYTWELLPIIYDAPLGASGYFLQSDEVPFYQLVTHGYIEYSGIAMNLLPDKQLYLLRSVEYGALPQYFGTYADSTELRNTVLEGMFAAGYYDWRDIAVSQIRQLGDLNIKINGQQMTGHIKLSEGIFQTSYENGVVVTVDYNTRTFNVS